MRGAPTLSYSQRYEDIILLRALGERADGFYIDIGAGHPIFDNVSFAFYSRGWRGLTVEPNPRLARLAQAIRPRDVSLQMLVGATTGEAAFHLVDDFHGLSTTIEAHARAAWTEFGKGAQSARLPMTTLTELCRKHVKAPVDFLKIDVEGAERDVIAGGDWSVFRPKIIVIEALAPYPLAPAWESWEPILTENGYRYAHFDSLNRYYVAEEETAIGQAFAAMPAAFDDVVQFRDFKLPIHDENHPDHALARLLEKPAMAQLPLVEPALLSEWLTAGLPAAALDRPAAEADVATACARLFGGAPIPKLPPFEGMTLREFYARLVASDEFRAAIGRISASYAW